MFKRIVIELSEPLCTCESNSLIWSPFASKGSYGLRIMCRECSTTLEVPPSKFGATFSFEKPYPKAKPVEPTGVGKLLRLVLPPKESSDKQ